jgi:hypothetical protein
MRKSEGVKLTDVVMDRVSDPHWFNADPDPAFFLIADPGFWWPKIKTESIVYFYEALDSWSTISSYVLQPPSLVKSSTVGRAGSLQYVNGSSLVLHTRTHLHLKLSQLIHIQCSDNLGLFLGRQATRGGGSVADPVFFWPLGPGSRIEKIQSSDPGSRMNIPDLIFETLVSVSG